MDMQRLITILLLAILMPVAASAAERPHIYVCRSPLLAFDFWSSLQDLQKKGLTLTRQIVEQVCNGMRAGNEPQCQRVEAHEFKLIASGWGGALAMSDGKTKVWFHNPDSGGWVHPDYYVWFVNAPAKAGN